MSIHAAAGAAVGRPISTGLPRIASNRVRALSSSESFRDAISGQRNKMAATPIAGTANGAPKMASFVVSDNRTKRFQLAYKWRIEEFAAYTQRCSDGWSKMDEKERRYYQFGAPVERCVDNEEQLKKQKEEGVVVFHRERFATPAVPELSNCNWHLSVFPISPLSDAIASRGYNPFNNYAQHVGVYLCVSAPRAEESDFDSHNFDLKVEISILDRNGQRCFTRSSEGYIQRAVDRRLGFDAFIKREEVLRPNSPYLDDGNFNLLVEVDVIYRTLGVSLSLSDPPFCLTESVMDSLKNAELTYDVILLAEDGSFKCHMSFLSERCAFFAEFFRSQEFSTMASGMGLPRISIPEVESSVVSGLIRYAYTNEILPESDLAEKLLVIADKYNTVDLKDACQRVLINWLCSKNCEWYLQLADQYSASQLKVQAVQFMMCCLNADENESGLFVQESLIPEAAVRCVPMTDFGGILNDD